jgi:hypothetical protein
MTVSQYRRLRERAEASAASRLVVARRLGAQAGIGSDAPFHMAHNAMCGLAYGQPWRGVDYSLVRRIARMDREMWAAQRIVDRIVARDPITR